MAGNSRRPCGGGCAGGGRDDRGEVKAKGVPCGRLAGRSGRVVGMGGGVRYGALDPAGRGRGAPHAEPYAGRGGMAMPRWVIGVSQRDGCHRLNTAAAYKTLAAGCLGQW